MNEPEVLLVYDGDCPVCNACSQVVQVKNTVGNLRIVDAREDSEIVSEISANGIDMDQGMVLKMNGQLYHGADAMHALALIGTQSGLFNRISYWVFRSKRVSRVLYPVLRFFRNLLLKLLGRRRINNLQLPGDDRF